MDVAALVCIPVIEFKPACALYGSEDEDSATT
jgi:hypothetical protein